MADAPVHSNHLARAGSAHTPQLASQRAESTDTAITSCDAVHACLETMSAPQRTSSAISMERSSSTSSCNMHLLKALGPSGAALTGSVDQCLHQLSAEEPPPRHMLQASSHTQRPNSPTTPVLVRSQASSSSLTPHRVDSQGDIPRPQSAQEISSSPLLLPPPHPGPPTLHQGSRSPPPQVPVGVERGGSRSASKRGRRLRTPGGSGTIFRSRFSEVGARVLPFDDEGSSRGLAQSREHSSEEHLQQHLQQDHQADTATQQQPAQHHCGAGEPQQGPLHNGTLTHEAHPDAHHSLIQPPLEHQPRCANGDNGANKKDGAGLHCRSSGALQNGDSGACQTTSALQGGHCAEANGGGMKRDEGEVEGVSLHHLPGSAESGRASCPPQLHHSWCEGNFSRANGKLRSQSSMHALRETSADADTPWRKEHFDQQQAQLAGRRTEPEGQHSSNLNSKVRSWAFPTENLEQRRGSRESQEDLGQEGRQKRRESERRRSEEAQQQQQQQAQQTEQQQQQQQEQPKELHVTAESKTSSKPPMGSKLSTEPLPSLPHGPDVEPLQPFWDYVSAETHPAEKLPCTDMIWGQTERDRVYNFLMYVPYQLERLIQFGTLLCMDSFLAIMTIMPYRAVMALLAVCRGFMNRGNVAYSSVSSSEASAGGPTRRARWIGGSQLYDIVCMLILLGSSAILRAIRPGFIYYWLKDITSEFLKMSVLSSAFEIADKMLCNFGLDVLEALSGTCTLWVVGRKGTRHLVADALVAFMIVLLHAVILMCQGLVLAVALNSKRNGLLALLIANNFVEIKGAVFKRWDVPRIWGLVCMDIVERLHLVSILVFVVIEDMESSGTWVPSTGILKESIKILGSEVIIDILKHAMLGKFNDVRPGLYREYMKDLCDKAASAQSHTLHKLLGFHHLAPGCLVLRTLTTLFWINLETWDAAQVAVRACVAMGIWLSLLVTKPITGYALKMVAHKYVLYYTKRYNTKPSHASRASLVSSRPNMVSPVTPRSSQWSIWKAVLSGKHTLRSHRATSPKAAAAPAEGGSGEVPPQQQPPQASQTQTQMQGQRTKLE